MHTFPLDDDDDTKGSWVQSQVVEKITKCSFISLQQIFINALVNNL